MAHAGKFARASEVLHKARVRIRVRAAKPVIQVNDEQSDSEPVAQGFEYPQKRDRISASGNSHSCAIPGRKHSRVANGFKHAIFE